MSSRSGTLGFGAMRLMLCNAAIKISTCAADRFCSAMVNTPMPA